MTADLVGDFHGVFIGVRIILRSLGDFRGDTGDCSTALRKYCSGVFAFLLSDPRKGSLTAGDRARTPGTDCTVASPNPGIIFCNSFRDFVVQLSQPF